MKKTFSLAITILIVGLVWVFAIAACTLMFDQPWDDQGSITGTLSAIVVAELYLLLRKKTGAQGTEHSAIGVIFTICFLLISVLLNSVFILLDFGGFNFALILLNVVLIAGYIILLIWVEGASARLVRQSQMTAQKSAPSFHIGQKLGELIAITDDAEVRSRLLKLKEAVDYGTNISTNATSQSDYQMATQLDELAQLTIARADRKIVLNKVEAAEMIWKMRSNTVSSMR